MAGSPRAISLCFGLVIAASSSAPARAQAGETAAPSEASLALQGVVRDHWRWWLADNPFEATTLGVRDYDDKVPDVSLEAADRRAAESRRFLDRLDGIADAQLGDDEKVDKAVLAWALTRTINANRFCLGGTSWRWVSARSWVRAS